MQDKNVFDKSEDLRKRFKFIFEAVSQKMRSALTKQRKDMNLTELKNYGENSDISKIRQNFKKLKLIATNLATLSLLDPKLYQDATEKILDEFDNAFFKYVSYQMNPFVNTMESISEEAVNTVESLNQFQSCQNEEDICQDHLRIAYDFVFQPFEINKFPYETLGFGTYMAYFNYLLLKSPETMTFMGRVNLGQEEEWIRAYESEVLGNLSNQNVGKMSIMELVQSLHHNHNADENKNDILMSLKNEADCEKDEMEISLSPESDVWNKKEMPCLK